MVDFIYPFSLYVVICSTMFILTYKPVKYLLNINFDRVDIRKVYEEYVVQSQEMNVSVSVTQLNLASPAFPLSEIVLRTLLDLKYLSVNIGTSDFRCSRHKWGSVSALVQVQYIGNILTFMIHEQSSSYISLLFLFPSLSRATMRATQRRPTSHTTAITVSRRRE